MAKPQRCASSRPKTWWRSRIRAVRLAFPRASCSPTATWWPTWCRRPRINIAEDEHIMAFLPFFHIYGMTVIMNQGLYQGATLVTMPRFELEPCLQAVQDYRVTRFFLVPPIVVLLAKHPAVDKYDL